MLKINIETARRFILGKQGLWPDLSRPEQISTLSRLIEDYDRVVVACNPEHRQAWAKFLKGSDVGGETLMRRYQDDGLVAAAMLGLGQPVGAEANLVAGFFQLAVTIGIVASVSPAMIAGTSRL